MKKSLLALGAAAIAISGMGAAPVKMQKVAPLHTDRNTQVQTSDRLHQSAHPARAMKAPAKTGVPEIITSPEGRRQDLLSVGSGYLINYSYIMQYSDMEAAANIVYGDNNEVYLSNIIPNAATDTYVKGVMNGDKIEVPLPQALTYDEYYGYGFQLDLFEFVSTEDDAWFYPMEGERSVTFTVAEDGTITADGINEDLLLGYGWTDDESWAYYSASELTLTPFDESPVSAPSDIEVSQNFWFSIQGEYGWPVSWAQGYDEFYFQGLSDAMPNAWFMGTVEYDDDAATISVAQNQYIGIYAGFYIYTKAAKTVYDEDGYEYYELLPDDYQYQLIWNYEDNTIVSKDPEVILLFNGGRTELNYLFASNAIELIHQDDFAGTPADPFGLAFDPSYYEDPYDPYGEFTFYVPAVSTEGDYLITDNLSYVVYVDGEEWEFDAEEYELEENMVEIPWDFSVYYIYRYDGILREVDFFVEGISTLGVQSIYRYNGEETRSEIVTIDLDDPSAVAAIGEGRKVKDVKYFDLSGRQVADPAAGIFVKRVTFEDGSVATFKKAVR